MIFDDSLRLTTGGAAGQAITGTVAALNTINIAFSDLGMGKDLYAHVYVTEAFSGGDAAAVEFGLTITLGVTATIVGATGDILVGALTLGSSWLVRIAPIHANVWNLVKGFTGAAATLSIGATVRTATGDPAGTLGAGKIDARMTLHPQIEPQLYAGSNAT